LKVLFAAQRWDYGERSRGDSFEYTNFFQALEAMDEVQTTYFDTLGTFRTGGHDLVRAELLRAIDSTRPDVVFFVLFEDELHRDLLEELRDRNDLKTYNWFCDDHWRFESFTRNYADAFDLVSTTVRDALPKYAAIGCDRVVLTQWACNDAHYRPVLGEPIRAVTFIGQVHSDRRWFLRRLERAGIPTMAWGAGWPGGRISQQDMLRVFSTSDINLNLSEASNNPAVPRYVRGALSRLHPPALRWWPGGDLQQIKGRNFEIPACGGFQLSGHAPYLDDYFEPDREIVLYEDVDDLIDRARFYLANDAARSKIAAAGHARATGEHTYAHRFRQIFDILRGMT
jgi:spore maturation protein CgeB